MKEQQYMYGVPSALDGAIIDVSTSLLGAKNYATRHGYKKVYRRNVMWGTIRAVAIKADSKWINAE